MSSTIRKRAVLRPHNEAEAELWLKNEALTAVQDCVAIADAGLPDAPLSYVNAAFERLTGYLAIEAVGRPCRFLQGAASDPVAREKLRMAIQERRECSVELLSYRKDGKTFLSRITLTPVRDLQDNVTHFVVIQSDITEQKRVEDALQATSQALQTTFADLQNISSATRALLTAVSASNEGQFQAARFASAVLRCPDLAGDLANCFPLDEHRIGIYLADVRAHGVPAALRSVMMRELLRAPSPDSLLYRGLPTTTTECDISEPVEVLEKLRVDPRMQGEFVRYLSMLYGVFDSSKRELRYASSGQIGMVLMPADGGTPALLGPAKFPAYLDPEVFCEQKVTKVNVGDRLYFCTDGLMDALDELGERLGIEGFVKAIIQSSCHPLNESVASITHVIENWCGAAGLEDDASVLGIEITP